MVMLGVVETTGFAERKVVPLHARDFDDLKTMQVVVSMSLQT